MGLYHEMVCDGCATTLRGATSNDTKIIALLRKEAIKNNWILKGINSYCCASCEEIHKQQLK